MGKSGFIVHLRGPECWWEDAFRRIPIFNAALGRRFAGRNPSDAEVLAALGELPTAHLHYHGETPNGHKVRGLFGVLALTGEQILGTSMADFNRLVVETVNELGDRGAEIITLGALTGSALTGHGIMIQRQKTLRYPITNGITMTGCAAEELIMQVLTEFSYQSNVSCVAVVGAAGSAGSALCQRLARRLSPSSTLLMVDAPSRRSHETVAKVKSQGGCKVGYASSVDVIRQADLVAVFTSAPAYRIKREHLTSGTIVIDFTTPRNTSVDLLTDGILGIDGDRLEALAIRHFDYGTPPGTIYACHGEAIILAHYGVDVPMTTDNPWVGMANPDLFPSMWDRANRLGFVLPPHHSFGRRLDQSELDDFKTIRARRPS